PRVPVRDQARKARRAADQDAPHGDRARRVREVDAARALRRHAAARVDRARARAGPGGAAHGRAVRRARRLHARRDEPVAPAALAGAEEDDRVRHAQHQRGDLPCRPRRRDDAAPGARGARLRHRPAAAASDPDDVRALVHRALAGDQYSGRDRRPSPAGGGMSEVPQELRDEIPSFEKQAHEEHGPINWSALTSVPAARSFAEIAALVGLFVAIFFLVQGIVVWTHTPTYVFPKPTEVVKTFFQDFTSTEIHSLKVTAMEFLTGLAIGSTIGLVLAALLTLKPFAEKIIAPYVLIMVTTPMLALVPFLRLKM